MKTLKHYKCDDCDKCYKKLWSLYDHQKQTKHNTSLGLLCNACNFSTADESEFLNHYKDSEQSLKLKCIENSFNKKLIPFGKTLEENCQKCEDIKQKPKRTYRCGMCEKKMPAPEYHAHKVKVHGIKTKENIDCTKCDLTLGSKTALLKHLDSFHKATIDEKQIFQCDMCDKTYVSNESLSNHKRKHHFGMVSPKKHEICKICDQKLENRYKLKKHIDELHLGLESNEIFTCSICKSTFDKKVKLDYHVRKEHKEKPSKSLKCDICDFKTSNKQNLDQHQARIHSLGRPQSCSECPYVAPHRKLVYEHFQKNHVQREKKFSCEICERKFFLPNELKNHQTLNHGVLKFKCEFCEYEATKPELLRSHRIHIHLNPREHKCDDCGKAFNMKMTLKRHIAKVHKKESCKEHKCANCDFSTIHNSSLKRHRISHHEDQTDDTKCSICNFIGKSKAGLKHHLQRQHLGFS